MNVSIVFQIAGIGILVAVLHSTLKSFGKDDLANLTGLAGLVIVLFMVIDMLGDLFNYVRAVFSLY